MRWSEPRVVAWEEHFRTAELEAVLDGPEKLFSQALGERLRDLGEGRLAMMDEAGIDVQVLSSAAPHVHWMPPADAVRVSHQVNDALATAVSEHPDRFLGLATLPTPAPGDAAWELERSVRDLGLIGAMVHGHTDGRFLDDESFWPILEAAQGLGVPVYLHPTYAPAAVADAYYAHLPGPMGMILGTGAMGWHAETALHVMRMILGGVFERFPGLQVIIGHLGEGLPFFYDRAVKVLRRVSAEVSARFAQTYRENLYLTTSAFFSDAPLRCALEVTSPDRILFGTDYPYSDASEATAWINATPVLGEAERDRILRGNSADLIAAIGTPRVVATIGKE